MILRPQVLLAWEADRRLCRWTVRLLQVSLVATAAGSVACIPLLGGPKLVKLADLSLGMLLVWSIGGPVADILTVSGFSVLLSQYGTGGSQARAMAYISMAGSLGRISYPALISLISVTGTWVLSSVTCLIAFALTFHFYAHTLAIVRGGASRLRLRACCAPRAARERENQPLLEEQFRTERIYSAADRMALLMADNFLPSSAPLSLYHHSAWFGRNWLLNYNLLGVAG